MKKALPTSLALLGLGIASAQGAIILSDSFAVGPGDYATGALSGQTGSPETGSYDAAWSGDAFTNFGDPAISATGLSYAGLTSSGGSIIMDRSGSPTTLTKSGSVNPAGTPADVTGSVYFSGLIQLGGANWASLGIKIGTGTGKSLMGIGINSSGFGELRDYGAVIATAGSALSGWSSSDTVFVVGKITNNGAGSGNDLLSLYLNPTLASEPGSATVSVGVGSQGWFPTDALTSLDVSANLVGQQSATFFDEINIGESWADVVVSPIPEPSTYAAILGLLGLGLAVYRRRR